MPLIDSLDLDDLTPSRLWQHLDGAARAAAARALYRHAGDDPGAVAGADAALARAVKFRPASVRKMPPDKRASMLARAVAPDDLLATTLLQSLHLAERRPLLGAFLDALGVKHEDGAIDPEVHLQAPPEATLEAAAATVLGRFPAAEVEVYLLSLVAVDPDTWGGLKAVLARRRASP
jgi:hypothetical protein